MTSSLRRDRHQLPPTKPAGPYSARAGSVVSITDFLLWSISIGVVLMAASTSLAESGLPQCNQRFNCVLLVCGGAAARITSMPPRWRRPPIQMDDALSAAARLLQAVRLITSSTTTSIVAIATLACRRFREFSPFRRSATGMAAPPFRFPPPKPISLRNRRAGRALVDQFLPWWHRRVASVALLARSRAFVPAVTLQG